ncbi:MAG: 50S ribosomal protein L17 [Candidatus Doudnabacteria bacterium CG10_big_fil_rev_8_21_14_0_10_41_10]|uniref:50S ribosomal protein L17 n=1 Tax=Candidatus Doudnabacteria bacterium CG10_big_fil_rev_8_21_14_0_10_41_10 TaxID=1974551 RepID=A0A2H0VF74_9BACT|nr:MAG: 50S ribosomal protein L17 [Candidatus Doudnabacteria bacterium CG10_big_fil_rev_8_21_14_0_10_41_10]
MRHRKKTKIGPKRDQARRLMRTMASSFLLYEHVETTAKKGKLLKSVVEKLISKGRTADLHKKRQLFSLLQVNAARKVFEVLGPKYKDRKGGYTRLYNLGKYKDGTAKVRLELV